MINVVLLLGNNQQAASGIKLSFNQQVELKLSVYYKVYNYKMSECSRMPLSSVALYNKGGCPDHGTR